MKIQGIIFDLGFTLMHLNGTWPEIIEQGAKDLARFLSRQGLGLKSEDVVHAFLHHWNEGFARAKSTKQEVTAEHSMRLTFSDFDMSNLTQELLDKAIDIFFACEEIRWEPHPEAIMVLKELANRGFRLGMFSNASDDRLIQRLVERFGFKQWLIPALSSAKIGIRKPDPKVFAPILEAWGLAPESVVMVGDSLDEDILGAQYAGMHHIWIKSKPRTRMDGGIDKFGEIRPEEEIEHLGELPDCLEKLL